MIDYSHLFSHCQKLISKRNSSIESTLTTLCELLKNSVPHYDWVGFYFADQFEKKLHLKAFAGLPTEHTTIPFGKGICGQVAVSNQTFLVEDVKAQDNYIACDIYTQSEIVVPLFVSGKNIGQIDIDSKTKNAFSQQDTAFLEQLNTTIANTLFKQ
ncbi:MAG: GAF domain-containing protein [Flavobacteriaceae bacterium]